MIVVDASAFVDFLAPRTSQSAVDAQLASDGHWVVTEHFTIEVVQALCGLRLRRAIDDVRLTRVPGARCAFVGR